MAAWRVLETALGEPDGGLGFVKGQAGMENKKRSRYGGWEDSRLLGGVESRDDPPNTLVHRASYLPCYVLR